MDPSIVINLLKIAVNNTNIIATSMNIETDLKQTTLKIIDYLKGSYSVRKDGSRSVYQRRKKGNHFPIKTTKSKDCTHCINQKKRSKTTFICDVCTVPLHPHCWKDYHEN